MKYVTNVKAYTNTHKDTLINTHTHTHSSNYTQKEKKNKRKFMPRLII